MAQQSSSGYIWSEDGFEGTLSPHRSSPIICVVDAAAELRLIIQQWRKYDRSTAQHEPKGSDTRSRAATMTLAVFTLGVLPQAIKLFCMHGIPSTQTLAAMFLLSSLVSMMHTLRSVTPNSELSDHVKLVNTTFDKLKPLANGLDVLGRMPHNALLFYVCYATTGQTFIALREPYAVVKDWISNLLTLTVFLAAPYCAWRKGAMEPEELQRLGSRGMTALMIGALLQIMRGPGKDRLDAVPRLVTAISLWCMVLVLSRLLAHGLDACARIVSRSPDGNHVLATALDESKREIDAPVKSGSPESDQETRNHASSSSGSVQESRKTHAGVSSLLMTPPKDGFPASSAAPRPLHDVQRPQLAHVAACLRVPHTGAPLDTEACSPSPKVSLSTPMQSDSPNLWLTERAKCKPAILEALTWLPRNVFGLLDSANLAGVA